MRKNSKGDSASFMAAFGVSMAAHFSDDVIGGGDVAVAVSGGADSLALCFALSEYFMDRPDVTLHALSVDHGLREGSAAEPAHVAGQLVALSNVRHAVLTWDHGAGGKPSARLQEQARHARYDLMREYMQAQGLTNLFLGHHMDDQAETFLFRLAKGSGLDGLSCMTPVQEMAEGFVLCRPFLEFEKADLVSFCAMRGVDFVDDPSNESDDFARVRLRKSRDILAAEGLSSKRLRVTAARLSRAREALEIMAHRAFCDCLYENSSSRIVFKFDLLVSYPAEIVLRVILDAMSELCPGAGYGARMERVERLCVDLIDAEAFRKRTLGGIVFDRRDAEGVLVLSLEQGAGAS